MNSGSPILVVEDNPADFFATQRGLRKAGFPNRVIHCATGEDALDHLLHRGTWAPLRPERPGLIFLDVNLPGIGGAEVLDIIRATEATRTIPVVMLSTSSDPRDVDAAYRRGANSYVQKPVDLDGFMAAVQRLKDYWYELAILPSS